MTMSINSQRIAMRTAVSEDRQLFISQISEDNRARGALLEREVLLEHIQRVRNALINAHIFAEQISPALMNIGNRTLLLPIPFSGPPFSRFINEFIPERDRPRRLEPTPPP